MLASAMWAYKGGGSVTPARPGVEWSWRLHAVSAGPRMRRRQLGRRGEVDDGLDSRPDAAAEHGATRGGLRAVVRRGSIYYLELPAWGRRPVLVLTRDAAIPVLKRVRIASHLAHDPQHPDRGDPR